MATTTPVHVQLLALPFEIRTEIAKHLTATHGVEEAALVNGDDFDGNALFLTPVNRADERGALLNLACTHSLMCSAVLPVLYENITVRGNRYFNNLLCTLLATPRFRNRVRRLTALDIDHCGDFASNIERYLKDQNLTFPNLHTLEFQNLLSSKDRMGFLPEIFWLADRSPKLHTLTIRQLRSMFRRTPDRGLITWPTLPRVKVLHLDECILHQITSLPILDFFPNLTTLILVTCWMPAMMRGPQNLRTLVVKGYFLSPYTIVCIDRLKHLKCCIGTPPHTYDRYCNLPLYANLTASAIQSVQILGLDCLQNTHEGHVDTLTPTCSILAIATMLTIIQSVRVFMGRFNNLEVLHLPPMRESLLYLGGEEKSMYLVEAVADLRRFLNGEKPSLRLIWRYLRGGTVEQLVCNCGCNPAFEEVALENLDNLDNLDNLRDLDDLSYPDDDSNDSSGMQPDDDSE